MQGCVCFFEFEACEWYAALLHQLHLGRSHCLRQEYEGLVDIDAVLGGALIDVEELVVAGEEDSLLSQDFSLLWLPEHDVYFVCHERNAAVCRTHIPHLLEPVLQIAEGVQARDIEDKDHTERASVVVGSHRLEGLTASCVPHLQVDGGAILELHQFTREFNA